MVCKIADLLVDISATGGLSPRCKEYLTEEKGGADIVIRADLYNPDNWPTLDYDWSCYMESGFQFYKHLLQFKGMMLHASAVAMDGKGYLFSAHCGVGKSTHTGLWQSTFGEAAQVFNDDKPALRRLDDRWYAYGTPWSGKNSINQNRKVPLAGICFLKQGQENRIRRLSMMEALPLVLAQTPHRFKKAEGLDVLLGHVDWLVREIPIYELVNRPEPEAARLSYETMCQGAKEIGL